MLNAYTPPIAFSLGCVAPKSSPRENARVVARSLSKDQSRGLGFADIALASNYATVMNHLQVQHKLRGDLVQR
ncbi:MAG: hypothetical protein ABI351_05040 [Herbaspirillum sp.]